MVSPPNSLNKTQTYSSELKQNPSSKSFLQLGLVCLAYCLAGFLIQILFCLLRKFDFQPELYRPREIYNYIKRNRSRYSTESSHVSTAESDDEKTKLNPVEAQSRSSRHTISGSNVKTRSRRSHLALDHQNIFDLCSNVECLAPSLGKKAFSQMSNVSQFNELSMRHYVGFDGYVYLAVLRMFLVLTATLLVFSILLTVPLFTENTSGNTIDKLNIVSLPKDARNMWTISLYVQLVTLLVCLILRSTYNQLISLSREHRSEDRVENYSIMIQNLSRKKKIESKHNSLKRAFELLFSASNVLSIQVVKDTQSLHVHYNKCLKYMNELNYAQLVYDRTKVRPQTKLCGCKREENLKSIRMSALSQRHLRNSRIICCCTYVDSIDYYTDKLTNTLIQLNQEKTNIKNEEEIAFITFSTKEAANSVVLNKKNHSILSGLVESTPQNIRDSYLCAPDPNDLNQINIRSMSVSILQRIFEIFLFVLLIIFWSVPIAFVSSLADAYILSKLSSNIERIIKDSAYQAVIENFLATLVFFLFTIALPYLLRYLVDISKPLTHSSKDRKMVYRYSISLIMIVFLKTGFTFFIEFFVSKISLSTKFTNQSAGIVRNSSFFISYIALNAFVLAPLELLRPGNFLFYQSCCRTKFYEFLPTEIDYGILFPTHYLVFILALVYSVCTPLILPFAFIYFAIVYTVFRYQLVYVYAPKYESSGKMWPVISRLCLVGLALFQVNACGLMFILGAYKHIYIICPSFLLTCIFAYLLSRNDKYFYWLYHDMEDVRISDSFNEKGSSKIFDYGNYNLSLDNISEKKRVQKDAYLTPVLKNIYESIDDVRIIEEIEPITIEFKNQEAQQPIDIIASDIPFENKLVDTQSNSDEKTNENEFNGV